MSFLNLMLVGGVAAFSIPLIIHLLHRHRFRVVRWGAMHLLAIRERTQKRRVQLEHLLLLLIRCAIPVVLALCLARPVLTGWQALVGAAKTSAVIVLDNSYSMDVGGAGRSAFTRAREVAGTMIEQLGRGSEIAVILMGGVPTPLLEEPTFDTGRAARELARQEGGYGAAAVPVALDQAAATLARMHQAHRELIVISDFQQVSWSEREGGERERVAALLKEQPAPPAVTFLAVGGDEQNNVSVEALELSRMLLGVGQRFQVRARLQNHGATAYPELRVYFRVDGQERSVTQVTLGPHENSQVLFTHTFEKPGSHLLAVDADAADLLKRDNALLASVPVLDKVPVLVVNGAPHPEPLRGETDFLEIALRPYQSVRRELADLITARVIAPAALDAAALRDVAVVVLANVAQLGEAQVVALEAFVRGGGGLLVFPGDRLQASWYNARLLQEGRGLLPLPLTALAGSLDDSGQRTAVLAQHFEHPALALFNDQRQGNLAAATVRLWYQLGAPPAVVGGGPVPFVMARLGSGDPFLAEKSYGAGTVIQSSVPCSAEWSNLPTRPFYLPLVQQLVTYLASKVEPPRNVEVGRPLIALLPAAAAGQTLTLTDPEGARHALKATGAGGRALVQHDATRRPGLYVLETADKTPIHFVVSTTRTESDLRPLPAEELTLAAKPFGAAVVRSWDEYKQLEQRRRYGREMWRPLLGLVLLLIFAEMWLQQRIGAANRARPVGTVTAGEIPGPRAGSRTRASMRTTVGAGWGR